MTIAGGDSWPSILPPMVVSPTQGGVLSVIIANTISCNPYVPSACGDAHVSTDWEIWTAPGGTGTRTWNSTGDTINKTSILVVALTLSLANTYYARARYNTALRTSVWSEDRMFTT